MITENSLIEYVYWTLKETDPTIEILKKTINEVIISDWKKVSNLVYKVWFSNNKFNLWGALIIWSGNKPDIKNLPENITKKYLKRPPDYYYSLKI